jgi:hypothetical protein
MSDPQTPPARREFVFRMLQLLMLADVLIGVALMALGLLVFDFPALAVGGGLLAVMGLGVAGILRMLSRRGAPPAAGDAAAQPRRGPHQLRR